MELTAQVAICSPAHVAATLQKRAKAIGREVDELREHGLCGTPAEILDKLAEYDKIGTGRVYLQVLGMSDLDHIREIGQGVLQGLQAVTQTG